MSDYFELIDLDTGKVLGTNRHSPAYLKNILDHSDVNRAVLYNTCTCDAVIVTKDTPLFIWNDYNKKIFYHKGRD